MRRGCLNFIRFSSSLPSFSSLYLLFVLHLVCFVLVVFRCSLCWFVFVFSFSLSDYTQKERAQVLCVLSCLVLCVVVLDVLKHYRYLLRFIVTMSVAFADDSGNVFRLFRWVVYYMPVFVYR